MDQSDEEHIPAFSGEKRFCGALIIRAIYDMLPSKFERKLGKRMPHRIRYRREALKWIKDWGADTSDAPGTFVWACNGIDLCPKTCRRYIRDVLRGKRDLGALMASSFFQN